MIVGAPEDDSEQAKVGIEKAGAVYRCQTRMPFRCDQIPFDTSGNLCPSLKIGIDIQWCALVWDQSLLFWKPC